jgi:hypothetical protein
MCLAIAIALVMLMIAVPSISGVLKQQQANQPFDTFDQLVRKAQALSLSQRRTYQIAWFKDAIVLKPESPDNGAESKGIDRIAISDNESYGIELSAALVKKPPNEWTFWPTGTLEPATITYKGPSGSWTAVYRPLSVKAEVNEL